MEGERADTNGALTTEDISRLLPLSRGVGRSEDVLEEVTIVVGDVGLPAADAGVMPRAWSNWAKHVRLKVPTNACFGGCVRVVSCLGAGIQLTNFVETSKMSLSWLRRGLAFALALLP